MSGLTPLVDTLLATRLAQRVDLVPLKPELEIAGPGPVTQVEEVTNDTRLPSRAALQQLLGVGLLKSDERGHGGAPAASGGTVRLSVAARALSAILDTQAGATAKIIGTEPLLPRSQPAQPHLLSAALARTVSNSGLFYESHLAQYAAGTRTLAELAQEPQARLDGALKAPLLMPGAESAVKDFESAAGRVGAGQPMALPSLQGPAAAEDFLPLRAAPDLQAFAAHPSDAGDAASIDIVKAGASSLPNPLPAGDGSADLQASLLKAPDLQALGAVPANAGDDVSTESGHAGANPLPTPLPAGPAAEEPPARLAASANESRLREYENTFIRAAREQEPAGKIHGRSVADAARGDAPGLAGIHPEAVALVRQQLELLAVPVFRWAGEAWPGTPMDWEIHEKQRDEREAASEKEAPQRSWSTRLTLTMPTLRDVEVRISLAGCTLQVQLAARENATLAVLNEGRHELPKRLGDLGLQLTGLQIGALAPSPAAQAVARVDDAS